VVPMIVGDDLIGSVSFGGDQAQFSAEQVAIAQEVAAQLAIAITQARLHEQVTRQAAELEQRVAERTRALETANHELEAFTHTVSHDLKAPLRGMEGFAEALEEDFGDRLDDTGRDFLSRIRASAGRMSRLIDDLLQYSRIEKRPGERGAVALTPLLDELLDELAGEIRARGISVTADLAVGEVTGEREGLREALANLLSNAVKFSPAQGGTIAVHTYRGRGPRGRLRHAVPRPHLRHLRAPTSPGGVSRHRRGPGHRAEGGRAPRRPRLGRVRAGAGQHVLPRHSRRAARRLVAWIRPLGCRPAEGLLSCRCSSQATAAGPGTPSSSLAKDATLSRSRSRVRIPPGSPRHSSRLTRSRSR